jgi:formylglycine-generating enzyme required for sulfatase activity
MISHSTNEVTEWKRAPVQPIPFRVFLASPGDVCDERGLARGVIEQVGDERAFRDRLSLKCIAWDQPGAEVAMEATLTPQEAIGRGLPKPSACDLVVVIFWSRMGTLLPATYIKADGTPFHSGTEWEYLDAITGARSSSSGRPVVWLYRRNQTPAPSFDDPEYEEKHRQWQKVKTFFQALVGEDGSLLGGVNHYRAPDEFRQHFEQRLRDHLTKVLEGLPGPEPTLLRVQEREIEDSPRWTGTPYPGLETFKPEQAPIFFGRGTEVDQLLDVLRDPTIRFVSVVGASGSGKSSLVAAGLIPRLRAGALPGSAHWIDISFKPGERGCAPGERGSDPFLALAYALKTALGTTGQRELDLAKDLRAKPDGFASCVDRILSGRPGVAELLLVIDQFEELFTLVPDEARAAFIELVRTMAETPRARVMVTMRVDFLAKALEIPVLADLFRGRGLFPLSAPDVLALNEMIRRPAQIAGLEIRDELGKRILKDTGSGPGALALMAFALHELYERSKESGRLTLQDYEALGGGQLGGVAGAIQAQAEKALDRLGQIDDRVLHELFSELVEVNDQGVATRRRAALDPIRKDLARARLVDALVDARILVTDAEGADHATVEVAHEAVFRAWSRLSRWIEAHASELRSCRRLIRAASDWQEAGSPPFKHLPDRATLKQYRKVLPICSRGEDGELVGRFVGAAARWQRLVGGIVALVMLVVSIGSAHIWLQNRKMSWNVLRIWTLVQMRLYDGPPMVQLPGGPFEIGSSDCTSESQGSGCPRHWVSVAPFWMGKYEVTFDEYSAFVLDSVGFEVPLDQNWGRDFRPVIYVSWEDAQAYTKWLAKVTGKPFRLPSEAEWEYAARAGTTTNCWWGDDIRQDGKVWANCAECGSEWDGKKTAPVGSFPASAFGLQDMIGNVWEWTEDDYHADYSGAPNNGLAWIDDPRGSYRVVRGGSWFLEARYCRSAIRNGYAPDDRDNNVGFRLSRSVSLGP